MAMASGLIKMRVREGRSALPYNDGTGSKLHQPLEVFEGVPRLLEQFGDQLEAIDDAGNVVTPVRDPTDAEMQTRILSARPHERVTFLQELRQRREEAHKRELDAIDQQIATANTEATREAEERNRAREARQAPQPETVVPDPAAQGKTPGPRPTRTQSTPQAPNTSTDVEHG
jgi:hypothetical protein